MSVKELNESNFASVLTDDNIVIIDFWAPWCGPCRQFAPTFEAASEAHPDIVFAKVNTEEEQGLAASFRIRSIPTLMIFREKVMLFNQAGALPASALEDLIQQVKALDMEKIHADIAAQQANNTAS
ncbi:thioredoxin [Pelistega europaea]|uniref:Thioredoxin n=1 Tax=Pelistega europaea TaxID=106147 RepID=A0A7Y4P682_9BURK|nr:thioredoxin [Pelistega europaea]NOL49649.1 thioredoxin [Pelistega europaea]